MQSNRRQFIKTVGLATAGYGFLGIISKAVLGQENPKNSAVTEPFQISLAQWSLHRALSSGKLDNLDFPFKAKNDFDIDIVEYVSPFFQKKEKDMAYLKELKQRTSDNGIVNHLIMVDHEGNLGDANATKRMQAVENHYKWVDAAKFLDCKTIRVNASGQGSAEEVKAAAIDGLSKLTEYGQKNDINIIVENHGGHSSNGQWLASVIEGVNSPYCGTLPDFGNFRISSTERYDLYKGIEELLPYAKGLSAKSYDFDAQGNETSIDYSRIFKLVKAAKWRGIVGIEYEGKNLSEEAGIRANKALLERIKQEMVQ